MGPVDKTSSYSSASYSTSPRVHLDARHSTRVSFHPSITSLADFLSLRSFSPSFFLMFVLHVPYVSPSISRIQHLRFTDLFCRYRIFLFVRIFHFRFLLFNNGVFKYSCTGTIGNHKRRNQGMEDDCHQPERFFGLPLSALDRVPCRHGVLCDSLSIRKE